MAVIASILRFIVRNINFKWGMLGGLFMGSFVYWLNWDYGFDTAIVPAGKQFFYTFLVGGSLVSVSESLSLTYESRTKSILLAVLVSTAITGVMLTAVHIIRGTPRPFYTIFWTTLIAPPGFLLVAILKRRKHDKEYDED